MLPWLRNLSLYVRLMDVIKQHLGGSPQSHVLGHWQIMVKILFGLRFVFENVFSPKGWQRNSQKMWKSTNKLVCFWVSNGFTNFQMQIRSETPQMNLNTSPTCFEGPRDPEYRVSVTLVLLIFEAARSSLLTIWVAKVSNIWTTWEHSSRDFTAKLER